jgi:hypothetical protein
MASYTPLADVTFTNTLGSFTIGRFMLTLSDRWSWNGRAAQLRKTIQITGTMARGASPAATEDWADILSDGGTETHTGDAGTLTLPWADWTGVQVESITTRPSTMTDWLEVQASFYVDHAANVTNNYTISWFGLTLHNPSVAPEVPQRRIHEIVPQMDWLDVMSIPTHNASMHPETLRTASGYAMQHCRLGGTILLTEPALPTNFAEIMTQRVGEVSFPAVERLPAGYPRVFDLQEGCPELGDNLDLRHVFVAKAQAVWNVEQSSIQVSIDLMCQPQMLS